MNGRSRADVWARLGRPCRARPTGPRWTWAGQLLIAVLLAACGADGGVAPGVDRIVIQPSNPSIAVGSQLALTVSVAGSDGSTLPARSVFWSSADPAIATVNSTGVVSAVKVGSAQIAASAGGRSGVTTVLVVPEAVGRVSLTLTPPSAQVGDTVQASATVSNGSGQPLPGRIVTFTSLDPTLAAVIANGRVVALNAGAARIVARSDAVADTATLSIGAAVATSITVIPDSISMAVGNTVNLAVTARDRSGNLVSRPVTFSSGNTNIATVTSAGLVRGVGVGKTAVTVRVDAITATVPVQVSAVPVAQVTVTPTGPSIFAGQTVTLQAVAKDAGGSVLTGRNVTWSSSDTAAATVNGSGLVTGKAAGVAVITATIGGVAGVSVVTVGNAPVQSVVVTPATRNLAPTQTVQLSAAATNTLGDPDTRPVAWFSNNAAIAGVSSSGLVTAGSTPGTATITATVAGVSGSASVTVALAAVQTVSVTPSTGTLVAGDSVQLSETAINTLNQPDTRPATWTTDNAAVATVSASGKVHALAAGSATITATVAGVPGTASITVTPAPVQSVMVSPDTATIVAGATTQLAAAATNTLGQPDARPAVWSSGDGTIAMVDQAGLVTGVAAGTVSITATVAGVSGSAQVTVQPPPGPPARISRASADPSVATAGSGVPVSVLIEDAMGNPLAGIQITFASDAGSIPPSGITDATGTATVTWILAGPAGTVQHATVTVSSDTTLNITFTATAQ